MQGCLSRFSLCVGLWWTGDLYRVYPASHPMTAGISSSHVDGDAEMDEWLDVCFSYCQNISGDRSFFAV